VEARGFGIQVQIVLYLETRYDLNMSKVSVLPPSGFRDFTPEEAAARSTLIETIAQIYGSHGFQAIAMPFLENLATLEGKGGGQGNEKLIFKVLKRGEALTRAITAGGSELGDMGLRFDLTLPLARYFSRFKQQLPRPFKVFQVGPVWRADNPQKGRFREFFQCDVDILGAKEVGSEVDCLAAILEVFDRVGMEGVELHLNDRRLLAALRDESLSESQWAEALVCLDKLDKIKREGVESELNEKLGSVPKGISRVLDSAKLENFKDVHPESVASLDEIVRLLRAATPKTKVVFNSSLVRGQDYYTGTIFELRHASLSGSLGGGGRYNRLLEIFGGEEIAAFGGSIGFERLCLLLQERGDVLSTGSQPQVFFPLFDATLRGPVLSLAAALRKAGLRVDVYPDAVKLKNQFKYADDRKIPFTAILGVDEWSGRTIKVKAMMSRVEETLALDPLEEFVTKMVQLCTN
jgi:histidyl-tRNA synthetase